VSVILFYFILEDEQNDEIELTFMEGIREH